MYEMFDSIVEEVILAGVLATCGFVIRHFRNIAKANNDWKEEFTKEQHRQRKAIWKINKTLTIFAKIIDAQTEKNHPEVITELEGITRELLDDQNE